MKVQVKLLNEPKLREPILITGLPGIGHVAKLSADYLVEQLKAVLFGEIYSPFFPPHVLVNKNGLVELMRNELFYWQSQKSHNDGVIFTGNTQAASPEGQYAVADQVLELIQKLGVKSVYSVAAYITDKHVEKPRVYAAATEPRLLEELKKFEVIPMEDGSIGGTNGLLFGLAKIRGLEGVCLLGETPGYTTPSGRAIVDAKSAQAVLEVLTKILSIDIDMGPLESQARMTGEFIERMEEMERRTLEHLTKSSAPKDRVYYI